MSICQIHTAKSYTCTVDGHSKFWSINVLNQETVSRWGKLGTQGQMQRKLHESTFDAEDFAWNKIQEKLKKGYVESLGDTCGLPADAKVQMQVVTLGFVTVLVCAGCYENVKAKDKTVKVLELL